jgi:hypothetical protein
MTPPVLPFRAGLYYLIMQLLHSQVLFIFQPNTVPGLWFVCREKMGRLGDGLLGSYAILGVDLGMRWFSVER